MCDVCPSVPRGQRLAMLLRRGPAHPRRMHEKEAARAPGLVWTRPPPSTARGEGRSARPCSPLALGVLCSSAPLGRKHQSSTPCRTLSASSVPNLEMAADIHAFGSRFARGKKKKKRKKRCGHLQLRAQIYRVYWRFRRLRGIYYLYEIGVSLNYL